MRKNLEGKEIYKNYGIVIGIFLIAMMISILIFFGINGNKVRKNTEEELCSYVERQCFHLQSVLDVQYKYMEGMADYASLQEDLKDEENLNLIRSLQKQSYLEAVSIIDENGLSTYNTGEEKDVSDRHYFQQVMKGEQTLSDPLISKLNGEQRVILCVPIYQNGVVKGALGGSYDLAYLGSLVFEDLYDETGFQFLVTQNGDVISLNHSADDIVNPVETMLSTEDNFYNRCERLRFLGKINVDDLREDFEQQKSGLIEFEKNETLYYMNYTPLSINQWMLCYVVPQKTALEKYSFIRRYELILAAVLFLLVVALFLVITVMNGRRQKALLYYARIDELTGIFNRRALENKVKSWITSEECVGKQAFLMMDIDHFKEINDVYGHAVGDKVLKEVGKILKEQFRESDLLGRIGGDEFVVFMKNVATEEIALKKAGTLRDRISEIDLPELKGKKITSSVGLAFWPDHGKSYKDIYVCADKALYETKRNGRNGCTVYDSFLEK